MFTIDTKKREELPQTAVIQNIEKQNSQTQNNSLMAGNESQTRDKSQSAVCVTHRVQSNKDDINKNDSNQEHSKTVNKDKKCNIISEMPLDKVHTPTNDSKNNDSISKTNLNEQLPQLKPCVKKEESKQQILPIKKEKKKTVTFSPMKPKSRVKNPNGFVFSHLSFIDTNDNIYQSNNDENNNNNNNNNHEINETNINNVNVNENSLHIKQTDNDNTEMRNSGDSVNKHMSNLSLNHTSDITNNENGNQNDNDNDVDNENDNDNESHRYLDDDALNDSIFEHLDLETGNVIENNAGNSILPNNNYDNSHLSQNDTNCINDCNNQPVIVNERSQNNIKTKVL